MRLCRILSGLAVALVVCVPILRAEAAPVVKSGAKPALAFEPNQGQADPAVKFLARGRGFGLFLTQTESVLVLAPARSGGRGTPAAEASPASVVRMRLVGADAAADISGVDPLPGRHHSLVGDPSVWRRDVPTFARVRYTDVYPGVSLVFYGSEGQLEYDFVVAPGADPSAVVMAFEGTHGLRVDPEGDLLIATEAGEVRLRRPLIYQEDGAGRRQPLDGGYVLDGERVRFRVAAHDSARPLVIDPILGYSTYLSGSSNDQGFGVAVDSAGAVYVTGTTLSPNYPISVLAFQSTRAPQSDAFVTKLDPTGTFVVYSTFIGGSGDDAGQAIAVDDNGRAFIAGTTNSNNFPTFAAFQPITRGGDEAFVAQLNETGSVLIYSTYLGSNGSDFAFGITLDTSGNAYVTGATTSPTFPNNNAIPCFGTKRTGNDAFVVRVNPGGLTLGYCTFIGGAGEDFGQAIAGDGNGNVWIAGSTTSADLPAPVGLGAQPFLGGLSDGFVARLDPTGVVTGLTYLGGTNNDEVLGIAIDSNGNPLVTGSTKSLDFPILAALQASLTGRTNIFVVKLAPALNSLTFATFLGGTGDDVANAIAINPNDSTIYIAGSTNSRDFPLVAPVQGQLGGGFDAFVVKLSAAGNAIVYSTYLGGASDEEARAIAVDDNGIAYVVGSTRSTTFPTVRPILGPLGLLDVFVTQITDVPIIQFTSANYQISETGGSVTISVQRIGDTTGSATVQFETSNGTATAGSDYGAQGVSTPPSGTVGFGPGDIITTFVIPIINNTNPQCEGDETVNLTLRNPSFGTVLGSRNTSTLTILETSACINFKTPTYQVPENRGPAQIAVSRSGPTGGPASVKFSTSDFTATAGVDYTSVVNLLVTFAPGVSTVNVPIPIINNPTLQGNRSVNLSLTSAVGAELVQSRSSAVLTIVDDEVGGTVQFAAAVTTVSETVGSAQILVSRTGSTTGGATVRFDTANGTAIAGTDFGVQGDGTPPIGMLTFGPGETSKAISLHIIDTGGTDGVRELTVTLSNPSSSTLIGSRATTTVRIVDDELPSLSFSAPTYSVKESAGLATIAVQLTGRNSLPVTVNYAVSDGSATGGSDYIVPVCVPAPCQLTFPPGGTPTGVRTKTFTVRIVQDRDIEATETVNLGLTLPPGSPAQFITGGDTAVLSIVDDDIGGTIQFASATYLVGEGAGDANIVLTRTGGTGAGATVTFATTNGTAIAGTDFGTLGNTVPPSSTVTFGAGEMSKTVLVPIIDNGAADGVRTVNLALSNPGPNATTTLGARTSAVLRIFDNDVSVGFSATTYSVKESAGVATIAVELTGVNVTPVSVTWTATVGTAVVGSDFGTPNNTTPPSGTLVFPAGGTPTGVRTKTFTVRILQDRTIESTETVNLTLGLPPGSPAQFIAGRDTAVLSIVDDDIGGVVQFSAATYSVGEGAGTASIVITRTGSTAETATVDYETTNGTATAGVDYTTTTGTAVFGLGRTALTFTVPVADTTAEDGVRTVNLRLLNPGPNATTTLGPRSTAVLKIIDNELSVGFSSPTYSVRENVASATITVELTGRNLVPVSVTWATSNGTATAGTDYGIRNVTTPPFGVLVFPPGGTLTTVRTRTFNVPIINNPQVEALTETVNLTLSVLSGPVTMVPTRDMATLTINDDDVAGVIQFATPTFNAIECPLLASSCNATLTVSRTGGLADGVTIDFATANGTALAGTDFGTPAVTTPFTGTVTFGAGQLVKTFTIPLIRELGAEAPKSFTVSLSNPGSGGSLGARTTATVNIIDTR